MGPVDQSGMAGLSPVELALGLSYFADALLPGDDLFPSASKAGAHGVLADRMRAQGGNDAPALLASAFLAYGGLEAPTEAARRLEAEDPGFFAFAQMVLTFAYYEAPAVIAAIRALGHPYNQTPQPAGYALRAFDPDRDTPQTPKGGYVRTEAVRRVDLSALARGS